MIMYAAVVYSVALKNFPSGLVWSVSVLQTRTIRPSLCVIRELHDGGSRRSQHFTAEEVALVSPRQQVWWQMNIITSEATTVINRTRSILNVNLLFISSLLLSGLESLVTRQRTAGTNTKKRSSNAFAILMLKSVSYELELSMLVWKSNPTIHAMNCHAKRNLYLLLSQSVCILKEKEKEEEITILKITREGASACTPGKAIDRQSSLSMSIFLSRKRNSLRKLRTPMQNTCEKLDMRQQYVEINIECQHRAVVWKLIVDFCYLEFTVFYNFHLEIVSPSLQDVSDFDRIISQSSSPWYLQKKNSVAEVVDQKQDFLVAHQQQQSIPSSHVNDWRLLSGVIVTEKGAFVVVQEEKGIDKEIIFASNECVCLEDSLLILVVYGWGEFKILSSNSLTWWLELRNLASWLTTLVELLLPCYCCDWKLRKSDFFCCCRTTKSTETRSRFSSGATAARAHR